MEEFIINLIPAIIAGFIIQVILHEIGHFIGGKVTGWSFLFIQIYRFLIRRTDKGLRLLITNDIGFQCIMYPGSINTKALIYTMGGCITNLLSALMGFILLFTVDVSPLMWLYVWCFSVFGIGLFFVNGRSSIKRVCNDRACYNLLKINSQARLCHNSQLLIAKQLMKGLSYSEIGEEAICLCNDIAKNDIEAYQVVLEYYYYLDMGNYMILEQVLDKVRDKENISTELVHIIEMELIYVKLYLALRLHRKSYINLNDIEKAIKRYGKKGDIHTLRVGTVYKAYLYYVNQINQEAAIIIDSTINDIKKSKYIYEGDKVFCIRQLMHMKGMM